MQILLCRATDLEMRVSFNFEARGFQYTHPHIFLNRLQMVVRNITIQALQEQLIKHYLVHQRSLVTK